MAASRFCRYRLRTTDMNAARTFYADVLGAEFWQADHDVSLVPLPKRAAAQGAPAHWLGHIGVGDVQKTAGLIATRGGQQLGPTQQGTDGISLAIFRDPFGAIMAVGPATADAGREPIAWHMSHSQDHMAAFAWYANLFGWTATETWDLGPTMGRHQVFAWDESGSNVGSMANTARLPGVHPDWLFYFRVANIEAALATVRARGGAVVGPMPTSSGDLVAACDDPQGAAFGLYQFAGGAATRR